MDRVCPATVHLPSGALFVHNHRCILQHCWLGRAETGLFDDNCGFVAPLHPTTRHRRDGNTNRRAAYMIAEFALEQVSEVLVFLNRLCRNLHKSHKTQTQNSLTMATPSSSVFVALAVLLLLCGCATTSTALHVAPVTTPPLPKAPVPTSLELGAAEHMSCDSCTKIVSTVIALVQHARS